MQARKAGDVSFLFCFPSNEDEFAQSWSRREEFDYLTVQYAHIGKVDPSVVWQTYSKLASNLHRLMSSLREMHVSVYRCATLADFYTACQTSKTVILLAHWRHETIFPHHLVAPDQIRRKLKAQALSSAKEVIVGLQPIHADLESADWLWKSKDQDDLVDGLDGLVETLSCRMPTEDGLTQTKSILRAYARSIVDEALAPHLRPGNRLELSDCLFDPREAQFGGVSGSHTVVDLLVCRSYYLATRLKKAFGKDFDFITGNEPVSILPRALIAFKALQLVDQEGCSYEEASLALREMISEESEDY